MGTPKALLEPGGLSFLERVHTGLSSAGCAPILVVVTDETGSIAREAMRLGASIVINPDPADGPIASLRCGLATLPADTIGAAWCPVDLPLVRPDTVVTLVRRFREHPDRVIVPRHGGRTGHPVVVPAALFGALCDPHLPQGARSVLRRPDVHRLEVRVDDPGVLLDIDTPHDYRAAFPDASAD